MADDGHRRRQGRGLLLALAAIASLGLLLRKNGGNRPRRDRFPPRSLADAKGRSAIGPGTAAPRDEPQHPAPSRRKAGLIGLWIGLFGAFFGLTLQTLGNYAVASRVCYAGRMPSTVPPPPLAWWMLLATTMAAILLAAFAFLVAYANWRSVREEADLQKIDGQHNELLEIGEGRTRFMAMAGMATSAMLLATILFHGVAVLGAAFCREIA